MSSHLAEPFRIIPMGGLGEIGLNMTLFEYGNKILIVDCGLMFPSDGMLGVDAVIPNFSYLEDRKDDLVALVITHGHEDHIGAIPYLLAKFNIPVYGTKLTIALLEAKLSEHDIDDLNLNLIDPDETLELDNFKLDFARVSHSIMDGVAIGMETPAGFIVHSGDFKLDFASSGPHSTDIKTLGQFGDRGVMCLMSDSTNVEQYGYTLTENEVGATLDEIFRDAKGRIIITLFASNIARIQQVFKVAEKYGRKICLSGRSMLTTVGIGRKLGYLEVEDSQLIELRHLKDTPHDRTLLLTTGSQGEPMSALSRIAAGTHKQIQIVNGDTVLLSSKFIPGNEVTIMALINNLFQKGAQVVYETISQIHTSGHAHKEELKLMIKLIRPDFFMPVHGEARHLIQHCNLARDMGVKSRNLLLAKNGDIIEFVNGQGMIKGQVPSGRVFVDGKGIGDVGSIVLTDRRLLAGNGVVTCTIVYDADSGRVLDGPRLISRGFIYEPDYTELFEDVKLLALRTFERLFIELLVETPEGKDQFSREIRRVFNKRMLRRPVIIPVFIPV